MQLVWKSKEEEKVEEVMTREGKIGNSLCILSHAVVLTRRYTTVVLTMLYYCAYWH